MVEVGRELLLLVLLVCFEVLPVRLELLDEDDEAVRCVVLAARVEVLLLRLLVLAAGVLLLRLVVGVVLAGRLGVAGWVAGWAGVLELRVVVPLVRVSCVPPWVEELPEAGRLLPLDAEG